MRILFAGTPAVAVPALRALAAHHDIAAVLTRPDAPVGRKRTLTPSPVKEAAGELGLPVIEAARLDAPTVEQLEQLNLDAAVVVAYGAFAGPRALSAARLGWFNLHFSLLPDYRGAAPVQRALIDGRTHSGVTVFRLDEGMDTGDIVTARELPLDHASAGEALDDYAEIGAEVLTEALAALAAGTAALTPQPQAGTLAPKLTADDAHLDFTRPAGELIARARGTTPAPGPWTTIEGKRTKLFGLSPAPEAPALSPGCLAAADAGVYAGTGEGAVRIEFIQPFGKARMPAADFLRGRRTARFDTERTA